MRKPIRIAVLAGTAGVIAAGGTAAAIAAQGDSQPTQATTTAYTTAPTAAKAAQNQPAATKAAGEVTAAQARQIALHRAGGGMVTETGLDHERGTAVWEVDLTGQGREYEVYIDAATGTVLGLSVSKASGSHASQPAPAQAAKVTAAQARQIALLRVPGARVTETGLDHEHGTAVWEIDLTGQGREYEVHLNAATGTVLNVHHDAEMADNH